MNRNGFTACFSKPRSLPPGELRDGGQQRVSVDRLAEETTSGDGRLYDTQHRLQVAAQQDGGYIAIVPCPQLLQYIEPGELALEMIIGNEHVVRLQVGEQHLGFLNGTGATSFIPFQRQEQLGRGPDRIVILEKNETTMAGSRGLRRERYFAGRHVGRR